MLCRLMTFGTDEWDREKLTNGKRGNLQHSRLRYDFSGFAAP